MPMFDAKTRVLIVDDAASMRVTVRNMLAELGFSDFTEAANGFLGFEALEKASPPIGIVFSDQNMPECTGLEFLKRVRADAKYNGVPFIMVTSEGEKQMILDAIKAGASNYITKPVEMDQLKTKLEKTAERFLK